MLANHCLIYTKRSELISRFDKANENNLKRFNRNSQLMKAHYFQW